MAPYQKKYTHLFNAVTDALDALEQMDIGRARCILQNSQLETERIYITSGEAGNAENTPH